ncbi:phosphotransferase [Myxacorys almedinensis]|nr:phosphotransferase [Myxacorys almedinensis]
MTDIACKRQPPMIAGSFPVIYSTLSPQAVVSRVLSCYNIPEVNACQFWHRGLSDVYLVETLEQPYILKVSHCHWRCKSEIEFELELLHYLHQHHLPVAYPLSTKEGQLFLELDAPEGKRYASLFIYAPGSVPLGDLNLTQAAKLGETLAFVHQAGAEFLTYANRSALTLEYLLDRSWQFILPFLKHRFDDYDYVESAIDDIKTQLKNFPKESPYWSICWGDPHSGNAHFTSDDGITMFDFDQCGYGWRAFDLGKFRQVAVSTGISRSVRAAFLNGYETVSAIAEFERAALPAFTQVAHIWVWSISLTNAIHHNYSRLDHSYFNVRLEQLKKLRSPDWQGF